MYLKGIKMTPLFENLCSSFNELKKSDIILTLSSVLDEWENFGKTWNDSKEDKLKLCMYTNIKSDDAYICNFLERGSSIYGGSRPGKSPHYMIYRAGKTEDTVYKDKDDHPFNDEDEAVNYFANNVKPIFEYLFNIHNNNQNNSDASNDIKNLIEGYSAKQVLRKAILLEYYLKSKPDNMATKDFISKQQIIDPLIQIYSDDKLDRWVKIFSNELKKCNNSETDELEELKGNDLENFISKSNFIATTYWNKIKESNKNNKLEECPTIFDLWKMTHVLWNWNTKLNFDDDNKNIILYGAPGTGKTYEVKKFLEVNNIEEECFTFIQFHPNYTYEDFIDGLRPCGVTESGQIKFDLINGVFKDFCIKANAAREKEFYFIVDEINRANLNSVLGETLSILETQYRHKKGEKNNLIETANSKLASCLTNNDKHYMVESKKVLFGIPDNIYFIGMMNDVDKSIDSFDLALRRRFRWLNFTCDYNVISDHVFYYLLEKEKNKIDNEKIKAIESKTYNYVENCKHLNNYIVQELGLGTSYQFGHSFFLKISNIKLRWDSAISKLFNEYLEPTLKEYIRTFCTEESEIEQKLAEAKKQFTNK